MPNYYHFYSNYWLICGEGDIIFFYFMGGGSIQIFFGGGCGGGCGHNVVKKCIDFFPVSDHLEQFGGVSFFSSKINYLGEWGLPPPPFHGKFHENIFIYF